VRLTTYHPCSAERQEIRDLNLPGPPWAISTACCGRDQTYVNVYVFLAPVGNSTGPCPKYLPSVDCTSLRRLICTANSTALSAMQFADEYLKRLLAGGVRGWGLS